MKYDLEERTAKFGEDIIKFCKAIKNNEFTKSLINQLIRAATSIGANYMEANQASSKKDFKNKIRISQKEANESKHWLRMISTADENQKEKCRELWKEAHELTLIFAKISKSCKEGKIEAV
ncbi:MAG TPA: four helix bundle protein [Candidatus Moranbacteria bacterium]|nr:four helix bundle protein [Candidatus Moranbacteria bacterium]